MCEGEKTKPKYSRALKKDLRLGSVTIRVVKGDCRRTVKVAAEDSDEYDQGWCVFDTEALGNKDVVREAVEKAGTGNLYLAVSNPAFEYWFLLHFKDTNRPFQDARAVIDALRRHFPEYEKNSDAYSVLKEHTDTAISNAERVLNGHRSSGNDEFENLSTGVHELVEALRELRKAQGRGCN